MSEKVETIKAMIDKMIDQKKAVSNAVEDPTLTISEYSELKKYLMLKYKGLEDEEDFAYNTH